MRCGEVKNRLNAYLDGELDERSRRAVEAHISKCAACRETLTELRTIAAGIKVSMPDKPAPEGFEAKVMAAAARMRREATSDRKAEYQPLGARRMTPAARFAAAALVMIGLGAGIMMAADLGSAGEAAQPEEEIASLYGLDYFTAAPEDSLAGAWLSMADNAGRKGND